MGVKPPHPTFTRKRTAIFFSIALISVMVRFFCNVERMDLYAIKEVEFFEKLVEI
jgi:hypothetical protein